MLTEKFMIRILNYSYELQAKAKILVSVFCFFLCAPLGFFNSFQNEKMNILKVTVPSPYSLCLLLVFHIIVEHEHVFKKKIKAVFCSTFSIDYYSSFRI